MQIPKLFSSLVTFLLCAFFYFLFFAIFYPLGRSLREGEVPADPKVQHPALFIMGEKDYVLKFPGMEDYIKSGKVKDFVPDLEIIFVPEGSHFVHEQFPDQVNQLILSFLNRCA